MKIGTVIGVFGGIALLFVGGRTFKARFDRGGVRKVFIMKTDQGTRLTVWTTRIYSKKVGADYDQLLATYDVGTGERLSNVLIDKRHSSDDFTIYWDHGSRAWGYRKETGIKLLDLERAQVLATEAELLKNNPQLGGKISLDTHSDRFNTENNALHVKAGDGRLYRLNTDGTVTPDVESLYRTSDKRGWEFAGNWRFDTLKNEQGYHVHSLKAPCSRESVALLKPELIQELNRDVRAKEKVWVIHRSALFDKWELLLSLMSGDGREHKRVNLSKAFSGRAVKVIGTYTDDKEVLILLASGTSRHASVEGFTLSIMRMDRTSGDELGSVEYF